MDTTKKAGMIAVTTIAAAGAAMAVTGLTANAEELEPKDTATVQIQEESNQGTVSFTEAAENFHLAEEKLNAAENEVREAEEAYSFAGQEQTRAEEDLDTAISNTEEAFIEAENGSAENLKEAEKALQYAETGVKGTQAGVNEFQRGLNEAENDLNAKEEQLNQVKAEHAVTDTDIHKKADEISQAEGELEAKKEEQKKAEENLENAKKEVSLNEQSLNNANQELSQAKANDDEAAKALEQAGEKAEQAASQLKTAEDLKSGDIDITETEQYKNAAEKEKSLKELEGESQKAADKVKNAEKAMLDAEEALSAAEQRFKDTGADLLDKEIQVDKAEKEEANAKTELESADADWEKAKADADAKKTERESAEADVTKANAEADALEKQKDESAQEAQVAADKLNDAWNNANKQLEAEMQKAIQDEAEYQKAYDAAKEALAFAEEAYKQGSLGFIDWMLSKEGLSEDQIKDLNSAREKLISATEEDFTRFGKTSTYLPDSRNNKVIVIGDENDATDLSNVYLSIQIMKDINELRLSDDNYVGDMQRKEAKTNFYFMALGQIATMRGAALRNHSSLMASCENLAFGYSNPNAGWYTKEKKIFDQIKSDLGITELNSSTLSQIKREASNRSVIIGHYTNLMYSSEQVMGVGFTDYGRTSGYNASSESSMVRSGMHTYTVEEFEQLFMDYYQSIDLEVCQERFDSAEENLNQAKAAKEVLETQKDQKINEIVQSFRDQLVEKQNAAIEAENAYKEACAKAEEAKAKLETKKLEEANANKLVSEKYAKVQDAESKLEQAKEAVIQVKTERNASEEAMNNARADVNYYMEKKTGADAHLKEKQEAFSAANENTSKAKEEYLDAKAKLDELTSDSTIDLLKQKKDKAEEELAAAISKKRKSEKELESAKQNVKNAKDALERAKEAVTESELWKAAALKDTADSESKIVLLKQELDTMKGDFDLIQQAEKERNQAERTVEHVRAYLNSAIKLHEKAKAEYAKALAEYESASLLLEKMQRLPAVNVDMAMLDDQDLEFLNPYIEQLHAAAQKVQQTRKNIQDAEKNLNSKNASLKQARVEYTSAQTDYILAKAEADKAEQQRKMEELLNARARDDANRKAPQISYAAAETPVIEFMDWTVEPNTPVKVDRMVKQSTTNISKQKNSSKENTIKNNPVPKNTSTASPKGIIMNSTQNEADRNNGLLFGIIGGAAGLGAAGAGVGIYKKRKKENR